MRIAALSQFSRPGSLTWKIRMMTRSPNVLLQDTWPESKPGS
jgi:hypothetical protein